MTTTNGNTGPDRTVNGGANGAVDPNAGTILPIDITDTMQDAYLDYAMSVIVARALPDVRDGLKPVHRRILYAMYQDLHLTYNKPHKKSARIVGEVLGKYHPHGDTAVYDAMVRMAQEFSLRYPLIDGQGNFGSVDGDNAAAMRYTEARLDQISNLMLEDLEKDTVNWHDNFDNSLREPDVLPAALPNLLINGASGIAVGMATNVPPHNLGEVVDALCYMIDHYDELDELTVEHLTRFIKGPDFPTGGILYRYRQDKKGEEEHDAVIQGYSVGKARLIVQAKAHFEEMSRNRSRIVITELPYQTNKTTLIERIASLVRDGKIEGITDLRDESDRTGMRVVIELTRNVEPKDILADLFKYTPLQQTFGMQMLALVDGQPRLLGLKRVLHLFIQHREEIIRRRSEYELARAKERAHILEGLLKALDILDEVIAVIRKSQRVETARTNLMSEFGFSEIQAQAILDMQLRRLAALERKKLQEEYKALTKRIKYLEDLLAHPEKILGVIREDLLAIKDEYGDTRRTQIVDRTKGTLTSTDLLPEQNVWVAVGGNGELHRQDVTRVSSTALKRSGSGSQVGLFTANTRDYLYLMDERGQCRRISIHEIPQDGRPKHLAELTEFSRRDNITAAISVPRLTADESDGYLFFVTEQGMVKRVALTDFIGAGALDPIVMNVDEKDRICSVFRTSGSEDVILVSSGGKAIRFAEDAVRSMGLAAGGVSGFKLGKGQRVVYAAPVDPAGELLTATEKGFLKRTPLSDYPTQGRNGGGVVTHKLNAKSGEVTAALLLISELAPDDPVATVSQKNKLVMLSLSQIPQMGRNVQGKQIVPVGVGDRIVAVQILRMPPDDAGPNGDLDIDGGGASATGTNGSQATKKATPAAQRGRARAPSKKRAAATTATAAGIATGKSTGRRRKRVAQSAAQEASAKSKPARSTKQNASPAKRSQAKKSPTTAAKSKTQSTAGSTKKSAATKKQAASKKTASSKSSSAAKSTTKQSTATKSTASKRAASSKSSATAKPATKSTAAAKPAKQSTASKSTASKRAASGKSSATAKPATKSTAAAKSTAKSAKQSTATKSTASKRAASGKSSATAKPATKSTATAKSTATKSTASKRAASGKSSATAKPATKSTAAAKQTGTGTTAAGSDNAKSAKAKTAKRTSDKLKTVASVVDASKKPAK